MADDKITLLPPKTDEFKAALDNAIRHLPDTFSYIALRASADFHYFSELKIAGFTEQQALEIVKARGAV